MNKILMLATYFPPAGGIGTFRITKFVKYLPEFEWEPVLLTVQKECYIECNFPLDDSLLKDIPKKTSIYRTGIGRQPKIFKYLFNDLSTRWLIPLFSNIGTIIKKEKPKLLFATGDPFYPLIVTPFAKRFFGIKYIIDLRDPWKLALPERNFKAILKRPINSILEPIVLNNAAKILVVSEQMAQQYREAYPNRPSQDFIVIPNGYDPDDYDQISPAIFPEFTIIYAGKFLAGNSFRDPTYFFQALKILKLQHINISFKYIGQANNKIADLINEEGLSDQVEYLGQNSFNDTISYMKGSNLLLLIGNGQETEQTGKIFDYLGCKRPILALASQKGGIADVIKNIDQVTLIENKDPNKIANAIKEFYLNRNNIPVLRSNISRYHRKNLTLELANVLNDVLNI